MRSATTTRRAPARMAAGSSGGGPLGGGDDPAVELEADRRPLHVEVGDQHRACRRGAAAAGRASAATPAPTGWRGRTAASASTPSRLSTITGPPVPLARPALEAAVVVEAGVVEIGDLLDHVPAASGRERLGDGRQVLGRVRRGEVEDGEVDAGIGPAGALVGDGVRLGPVAADVRRRRDRRRVAVDLGAALVEDLEGCPPVVDGRAGVVPVVGEAGDRPKRAVRPGAADDDGRVGLLHGLGLAPGLAQGEVACRRSR